MGVGYRRALARRKGLAIGVAGYRRALVEQGQGEGAGGELWPGGRQKEGVGGGWHWVEAPRVV
jgi:hypothetical protein